MTAFPAIALIVLALCAGSSTTADAGPLTNAVRNAAAKRAAQQPARQALPHRVGKPRDVIIRKSKHPEAAANIEHSQRTGQPSVLHIDRAGADARRREAIGGVNSKTRPGRFHERDEYPPAFTREGGHNANVRFIHRHDNRGAGSSMRWQTRDLPDGSKIRVLVTD